MAKNIKYDFIECDCMRDNGDVFIGRETFTKYRICKIRKRKEKKRKEKEKNNNREKIARLYFVAKKYTIQLIYCRK